MTAALHSTLGASSSHRWLECPGSIRLSKGMPNESSVYAREGSCAHAIAEMCLTNGKDAIDYLGYEVPEYADIDVDESMCEAVQTYLDVVRADIQTYGQDDYDLGVEIRFDLSHVHPDMFGTCDAVLYLPQSNKLIVYDYKHGWISVAVERNPQTMYYAVGALTGKHNRVVAEVELVIVQPRSGQHAAIKRWSCDPLDLLDFIGDLKNGARRTEHPDAEFKAGEWCKWCPASPICKTLESHITQLAMAEFDGEGNMTVPEPDAMPMDRLKIAWKNATIIESWAKNIKAYAHSQAIAGNILPGCKLVEGRSRRNWIDEKEAEAKLRALEEIGAIDSAYAEPKLKTPAQAETQLGKKYKSMISTLWCKSQGGLSLVSEEDERPTAKVDALKEFS